MQNLIVKFDAATAKRIESAIDTIRASEITFETLINDIAPAIIGSVWAGDHIQPMVDLVGALKRDRKAKLIAAVSKLFPNKFEADTGKFGKRYEDKNTLAKKARAFDEFLKSGVTFYDFMTEKKAKVEKAVDWRKKLESVVHGAVSEGGFTLDDVMAVVRMAARAEMAIQEKAQAEAQLKEHAAAIAAQNEIDINQAVKAAAEFPLAEVA